MNTSTKTTHIVHLTLVLVFSALLFTATPVRAESAQTTTNSAAIFGTPSQSSVQGATFQQSGSSGVATASGSASTLNQPATGPLQVTGTATSEPAANKSSSTSGKTWLILVFITSVAGLVLLYLYTRQANKRQAPQEALIVDEVLEEAIDQAKPKRKKDGAKKKKKNKKHHR